MSIDIVFYPWKQLCKHVHMHLIIKHYLLIELFISFPFEAMAKYAEMMLMLV